MSDLMTAIPTGITAFTATNLDDIVILLLFFSQVDVLLRRHIVIGQYLGFTILVLASLSGFLGSMLLPQPWIGMLGIVPIAIGISRLLHRDEDDFDEKPSLNSAEPTSLFSSLLSPQTLSIASITVANGSDNIGIYVPLFASCSWTSLLIILGLFFGLVGIWCYAAYRLTCVPTIANALAHYGGYLVPFVLIGIGTMVLLESHTLEDRSLLVLTTVVSGISWFMLNRDPSSPEAEKQL